MLFTMLHNYLFISLIALGLNLVFYVDYYVPIPKIQIMLIQLAPYCLMLIFTLFYRKRYTKKVYKIYFFCYLFWMLAFVLYLRDLTSVVYYDGDIIMKYAIPKS
jgi:hypothetical protein